MEWDPDELGIVDEIAEWPEKGDDLEDEEDFDDGEGLELGGEA